MWSLNDKYILTSNQPVPNHEVLSLDFSPNGELLAKDSARWAVSLRLAYSVGNLKDSGWKHGHRLIDLNCSLYVSEI